MIVLEVCIVVLLVGLTAAAVAGKLGGGLSEPVSSLPSRGLSGVPAGTISAQDVAQLRLDQGLRGYRMDQVDDLLETLAAELAERDQRIAELQRRLATSPGGGSSHGVGQQG